MSQIEREMMLERQAEGYAAAKAAGRKGARGNGVSVDRFGIVSALAAGASIRTIAKDFSVSRLNKFPKCSTRPPAPLIFGDGPAWKWVPSSNDVKRLTQWRN